jgi:hypothetical protein
MASLTANKFSFDGVVESYTPCDVAGDSIINYGKTIVVFKNTGGSSRTITLVSQKPCNQGHNHDAVYTLDAGDEIVIGPIATGFYNNGSSQINFTYDSVVGLSITAYEL